MSRREFRICVVLRLWIVVEPTIFSLKLQSRIVDFGRKAAAKKFGLETVLSFFFTMVTVKFLARDRTYTLLILCHKVTCPVKRVCVCGDALLRLNIGQSNNIVYRM